MDGEILEGLMAEIASHWEPTGTQKDAAGRSQNALREALDNETKRTSARIIGHYLSGSYARHTAIAPIDDVDIIFLIDPREWETPWLSQYPEPAKVLGTFERAIRTARGASRISLQRRSVCLGMNSLAIDAVPAIQTDRDEYVMIPDRSAGEWILTAPRCHARIASGVNQQRGNLFIPLVKILKGWNAGLPDRAHLKSFTVETIAVRIFRQRHFDWVRILFDDGQRA